MGTCKPRVIFSPGLRLDPQNFDAAVRRGCPHEIKLFLAGNQFLTPRGNLFLFLGIHEVNVFFFVGPTRGGNSSMQQSAGVALMKIKVFCREIKICA